MHPSLFRGGGGGGAGGACTSSSQSCAFFSLLFSRCSAILASSCARRFLKLSRRGHFKLSRREWHHLIRGSEAKGFRGSSKATDMSRHGWEGSSMPASATVAAAKSERPRYCRGLHCISDATSLLSADCSPSRKMSILEGPPFLALMLFHARIGAYQTCHDTSHKPDRSNDCLCNYYSCERRKPGNDREKLTAILQ